MPNWEFPQCRASDSRLILTAMNDDFPILAAIASKPTHSHGLFEHLQAAGVTVTKSTLYRHVDSLLAKGWLEAEDVPGEGVRSRRPLTLSDAGRTRVDAEAAEILCSEPLESPLFALAFSAVGEAGPELLAILRPRMALAATRLAEQERSLRDSACTDAFSRSARERRMSHLKAEMAWLLDLMGRRVVNAEERRGQHVG
jgi:DNA-binding MarR family transcriptional regulator